MRNNSLDDIVKCTIEISNPASSDVSFDSILMVVEAPTTTGTQTLGTVTEIARAEELLDFGYTDASETYKAATIAFSQNPAPSSLLIYVRKKDDKDVYETIPVALNTAIASKNFYGIYLCGFNSAGDIQAAVSWAEANEKLFAFGYTDIEACPIQNFSYYRSFGVFSGKAEGYETEQPDENKHAALAWLSKCFGYDPGTETWHLKELATIVPSGLSTTNKAALEEINISSFLRYAGCNVTIGGKTLAGEWIDVIRFRDWLKAEIQTRVFNVLKNNRKVPYTDAGVNLISGAISSALKDGQDIGGIADDFYDAAGTPTYGYQVTVPNVADLTEAQRKSRKLPGCKWSARLAGAIHAVEIEGYLTF